MNLVRRVGSAVVLIAIVGACLWVGGPPVGVLVAVAVVGGTWEFSRLATRLDAAPLLWLLYPLALWWGLRFYLSSSIPTTEIGLAAAVGIGLLGAVVLHAPTLRWATTVAGAAYVGLGLGYFVGLYLWSGHLDHLGLRLVALGLVGPIAGDTAAFFVGSAIGRHRFFPAISPKKSVEGAIGSAIATVAVLAVVANLLVNLPWWQGALLGGLVTVAAQGGDLAESKFKREADVKDSSTLIPGHGGLLDRLDSLLLVAPVVYWFMRATALA